MPNPNIIIVDGQEIRIGRGVEFSGATLSVPNNKNSIRLEKSLASKVEGESGSHTVVLNGEKLPKSFLLSFRAPKRQPEEG